jgi:hypothetical protein
MKFCTNCGCQLDDDARFCGECGAKQAPIHAPLHASAPTQPSRQNSDVVINQPDIDTISISIKSIPFNLKLVEGRNYGEVSEIADFYIGETPVTQALWLTLMGENPSNDITNLEYPVTNISDQLVNAFLLKLSKATGVEFELPTRKQWLIAYHGGNKSKNFEHCGSNDINKVAWTDDKMHPVAQLYANELGLHDMEGLIREKLADEDYMKMAKIDDNSDDKSGELGLRVLINVPVDKKIGMDTQLQQLISNHQTYLSEVRKLQICELKSKARKVFNAAYSIYRNEKAAKKYSDLALVGHFIVLPDSNGVAVANKQELRAAQSVIIADCVKEIPSEFFKNQTHITEIVIPSSVTRMGFGVFDGCTNLQSVKFEVPKIIRFKSLTRMFANCTSIKDLSFMRDVDASHVESVTGMLKGCTNLRDITAISHWKINRLQLFYDDVNFDTYKKEISKVPRYETPSGELPNFAIKSNDEQGWEPEYKDEIGYSIHDKGTTLIISGKGDMKDFPSDTNREEYEIRNRSYRGIDENLQQQRSSITTLIVEEGVTSIGDRNFCEFKNLERVFLPKGLKSIGFGAFEGCSKLHQVLLQDGLAKIDSLAFTDCSSLKFLLLPNSIREMHAMYGTEIDYLDIPDNCKEAYGCCSVIIIVSNSTKIIYCDSEHLIHK